MPVTTITPRGRFSLAESIDFGFGARDARPGVDVMRLAFTVDGYHEQAGVAVTQDADGTLRLDVDGAPDVEAVTAQVARVLSVDVDASGWDDLGGRDELIGELQHARPGLRPPLFHSAYEAAAWAILSARRPRGQMAALRDRFAALHGATFEVAGEQLHAFPTPEQLLAVEQFPGLPDLKLRRLHALARAALDGDVHTAQLAAMPPAEAAARVQTLEGIGPFYASLVVIRALGHTDELPSGEPLVLGELGRLLGCGRPVEQADFEHRARAWSPWRTWATVALRAAGPRIVR